MLLSDVSYSSHFGRGGGGDGILLWIVFIVRGMIFITLEAKEFGGYVL